MTIKVYTYTNQNYNPDDKSMGPALWVHKQDDTPHTEYKFFDFYHVGMTQWDIVRNDVRISVASSLTGARGFVDDLMDGRLELRGNTWVPRGGPNQ